MQHSKQIGCNQAQDAPEMVERCKRAQIQPYGCPGGQNRAELKIEISVQSEGQNEGPGTVNGTKLIGKEPPDPKSQPKTTITLPKGDNGFVKEIGVLVSKRSSRNSRKGENGCQKATKIEKKSQRVIKRVSQNQAKLRPEMVSKAVQTKQNQLLEFLSRNEDQMKVLFNLMNSVGNLSHSGQETSIKALCQVSNGSKEPQNSPKSSKIAKNVRTKTFVHATPEVTLAAKKRNTSFENSQFSTQFHKTDPRSRKRLKLNFSKLSSEMGHRQSLDLPFALNRHSEPIKLQSEGKKRSIKLSFGDLNNSTQYNQSVFSQSFKQNPKEPQRRSAYYSSQNEKNRPKKSIFQRSRKVSHFQPSEGKIIKNSKFATNSSQFAAPSSQFAVKSSQFAQKTPEKKKSSFVHMVRKVRKKNTEANKNSHRSIANNNGRSSLKLNDKNKVNRKLLFEPSKSIKGDFKREPASPKAESSISSISDISEHEAFRGIAQFERLRHLKNEEVDNRKRIASLQPPLSHHLGVESILGTDGAEEVESRGGVVGRSRMAVSSSRSQGRRRLRRGELVEGIGEEDGLVVGHQLVSASNSKF